MALARIGRTEDAVKALDAALEIDPVFEDALFEKGKALSTLGMFREAVKTFDKTLLIDKNYAGGVFP